MRQTLLDRLEAAREIPASERAQAVAKLARLQVQLGFPESWPDDSGLEINPTRYAANVMASNSLSLRHELSRVGRPLARPSWPFPPQTANAYYSASENTLTLPAGLLRPPVFSPDYDEALNFGGLGSVVAHELVHAFDGVGRQFDAEGRRLSVPAFAVAEVLSGHKSGERTADECLADRAGLRLAYQAFQATSPQSGQRDGYTPDQHFFLSFARVWANNTRPEHERWQTSLDPHPPARLRVNQALKGLPEFYAAFP